MDSQNLRSEDINVSIRSIIHFLNLAYSNKEKKLILSDLLTKLIMLPQGINQYMLFDLLRALTSDDIKPLINDFIIISQNPIAKEYQNNLFTITGSEAEPKKILNEIPQGTESMNEEIVKDKKNIDIAFITIKKPELLSAKIGLNLNLNNRLGDEQYRSYRYWMTTISSVPQKRDLSVVLTMVGKERNVNCANACRTLFDRYNVGLCILVGMAAGPKNKVKLGDVVTAETVYDYEGARLEKDYAALRPKPYNIDRLLSRNLDYFEPEKTGWLEELSTNLSELKKHEQIPTIRGKFTPNFKKKVILSGEKLIVDDSIDEYRKKIHDDTRALEMEASGFANACEECRIPWLVFRGISDYGEPNTKDMVDPKTKSRKSWQPLATLAAVTAAINFLKNDYNEIKDSAF